VPNFVPWLETCRVILRGCHQRVLILLQISSKEN
jgi:hypothetical protein